MLSLGVLLALPVAARAESVDSGWSQASHSAVRLVAGGRNSDGAYRIGVEIRMKEGFKTYWRMPGDAGVPPVFDWTASENLGSVSVRWPAPQRYVDGGVTTIGYKDRVVFPVVIRAADTGKPTTTTLKLDYAVCERICIPAKADVVLKLPAAPDTAHTADLDAFRALVPRTKEAGKLDDKLGLISAAFLPEKGQKSVDVTVAVPPGAVLDDAFLEGPDGWLFGTPKVIQSENDKLILRVPIDDRPKNVSGLVPVVLTLSGKPQSTEIRFDIDIVAAKP
ncbi:MAG: protein-disulfide reductase DsbD domain-containing protein [Bosea sp. (in: a-proteobacteria)]